MQGAVVLSALSLLLCVDASKTRNWTKSETERTQNLTLEQEPRRPHLIFILVDDQGYNDIGYHNPRIQTPTLDRLASEGVRLESYYVQPICTPSRSQLLTGRYQIHSGLQHSIIRPQQPNCLPPHLDTLPQRLQGLGYSTHLVGKWHLGFYRKSCLPTRKGFDSFFGSLTGSVDYYSYGSCDGPGVCGYDLHDNDSVAWGHEGRYSTALFTQKARHILQTHDPRRPLFLLLSLQAVHTPLLSPRSYLLPYRSVTSVERRKFLAMVSTVDEAVRNVTYALRRHGFYKNSVLIYSTDNGAQPFTGGSNWPLRGRKGTYWEGGIRGVGFVHSPLIKRRRRVSTDLLHITDWFPTLVRLAGGDPHQSTGLDGFDVWPTISEGKPSPRTEILHNIDPLHRPYRPSAPWDATGSGKPKRPKLKKPPKKKKRKKKVLRLKPKQKSAFKLKKKNKRNFPKNFRKTQRRDAEGAKSRGARRERNSVKTGKQTSKTAKPTLKTRKSTLKIVKPTPKTAKPTLKTGKPILRIGKPTPKTTKPTLKTRKPTFKIGKPTPKTAKPTIKTGKPIIKTARPTPKTRKPIINTGPNQSKSGAKKFISQLQNTTLPTLRPVSDLSPGSGSGPGPEFWSGPGTDLQSPGAVWDTSVQAAIRVGDWKLLTGDPGHGDWVPPQVVPSLPGRWWNLERSFSFTHKSPAHRSVWLFNISADPFERQDLSDHRPEVVQVLLQRLVHYNRTAVPVSYPPDDPRANPNRRRGAWEPWVSEEEEEEGTEEEEEVQRRTSATEKKDKSSQKKKEKRKKGKCHLCKLQAFFHKLNSRMMENKI